MNKSTTKSLLIGGCALLTLLLWYFSQQQWSHFSAVVGIKESFDTRTWYSFSGAEGTGANYYLGGSFVLLFAAGWLVVNALQPNGDASLSGSISLGVALLAIIALARWYADFSSHPDPTSSRYGSSGQYLDDAAVYCGVLTVALIVMGIITLLAGRPTTAPAK